MKQTEARWAQSVHDNFRFTFKLFREITHAKNLDFDKTLINTFMDTIAHADPKKGCVLIQFPPSLKSDQLHRVDNLLHLMNNTAYRWPIAVEFRDRSWHHTDVYNMLESHNAALVLQDIPKSATPMVLTASEMVYVRFHGPAGNYDGSYTKAFLQEYAGYVKEWMDDGRTVYVYFNNTKGDAFNNLITFRQFV